VTRGLTAIVTRWFCAYPVVVEVRFQEPEPFIDPTRDVGIERRTPRILDLRRVCNVGPQRRGVGREALRQRLHMGVAIHDSARILRQSRVRRRRANRTPRHPTQHHEAFGHQVDVRVEFNRHGGEEGMQQD
jgi:hypothetical protein